MRAIKLSAHPRVLAGALALLAGASPSSAAITLPAGQIPVSVAEDANVKIAACRFFSDRPGANKNDFSGSVDWGDGTPVENFTSVNKNGKTRFVVRRNHTYATCGNFTITCNIDDELSADFANGITNSVVATSGAVPVPTITFSTSCPAAGAIGLTASVPDAGLGIIYEWGIVNTRTGADLDSQITAGGTATAMTFDAATAGTNMSVFIVESTSPTCPAATNSRRVQVDYTDVAPAHPFHDDICTVSGNLIAGSCDGAGAFCPDGVVTRQGATFALLLAEHFDDAVPFEPNDAADVFADVPSLDPFADWVETFSAEAPGGEGYMAACDDSVNPPRFCPTNPVTRGQMSRLVVRLRNDSPAFTPAEPLADPFPDVPVGAPFDEFINELRNNMTAVPTTIGCEGGNFCPDGLISRSALAHWLRHMMSVPAL